jgi:hypothetical protein
MHWVEAESRPGIGEDPTSWKALISSKGNVVQTVSAPRRLSETEFARIASLVRARRHSEIKPRDYFTAQQYSAELTASQIARLRERIEKVDFDQVARAFAKFPPGESAIAGVSVHSAGGLRQAMGPCGVVRLLPECTASRLLTEEEGQDCRRAFEAFFELWNEIGNVMPWRGGSRLAAGEGRVRSGGNL